MMDPEAMLDMNDDGTLSELPLFAGDEAKAIFDNIRGQREKLEAAATELSDHEERHKVMVEHLKNVRQEVQHTTGLTSAKQAEIVSEEHAAELAKREAGRYRQELRREQLELEKHDGMLNALQNQVFQANEKMDGFKLQMNWNQEELEQWALAAKQKEEDNLAIQRHPRRADTYESRRRRGWEMDIPLVNRGDAAGAARIVRGDDERTRAPRG